MTDTRARTPRKFEMIPIDEINVLNPRARNRHQHREIIDNIANIGLKRPITVAFPGQALGSLDIISFAAKDASKPFVFSARQKFPQS